MQQNILLRLLTYMEDPWVVWSMVLVFIAIRVIHARMIKREERDAAAAASRPRRARKEMAPPPPSALPVPKKRVSLEIIDTLLIALILVFGIVRPFLLQTFFIPSSSMEPKLLGPYDPEHPELNPGAIVTGYKHSGDKIIANKFVLHFRAPRRGEIIVFQPPVEAYEGNSYELKERSWLEHLPKMLATVAPMVDREALLASLPTVPTRRDDFIKRIIGVPGDRIRIEAGKGIRINNTWIKEPYLLNGLSPSTRTFPRTPPEPKYVVSPTIDVNTKTTLFFNASEWYDYNVLYLQRIKPNIVEGDFIVPDNSVFVMGDNRTDGGSFDSRYWGVVPFDNIKGLAIATWWPPQRVKLL